MPNLRPDSSLNNSVVTAFAMAGATTALYISGLAVESPVSAEPVKQSESEVDRTSENLAGLEGDRTNLARLQPNRDSVLRPHFQPTPLQALPSSRVVLSVRAAVVAPPAKDALATSPQPPRSYQTEVELMQQMTGASPAKARKFAGVPSTTTSAAADPRRVFRSSSSKSQENSFSEPERDSQPQGAALPALPTPNSSSVNSPWLATGEKSANRTAPPNVPTSATDRADEQDDFSTTVARDVGTQGAALPPFPTLVTGKPPTPTNNNVVPLYVPPSANYNSGGGDDFAATIARDPRPQTTALPPFPTLATGSDLAAGSTPISAPSATNYSPRSGDDFTTAAARDSRTQGAALPPLPTLTTGGNPVANVPFYVPPSANYNSGGGNGFATVAARDPRTQGAALPPLPTLAIGGNPASGTTPIYVPSPTAYGNQPIYGQGSSGQGCINGDCYSLTQSVPLTVPVAPRTAKPGQQLPPPPVMTTPFSYPDEGYSNGGMPALPGVAPAIAQPLDPLSPPLQEPQQMPTQRPATRSAALTPASLRLQGVAIYQGDSFSARARVAGIYPLSPQVLVGVTVDFTEGNAFSDSREQGLSLNELYLAASLKSIPNLRFAIGQLDLTSYFDRNSFAKDGATHFFNSVFQTNPALASTGIGSRPAALVNWTVTDNIEAKAAIFSSSRSLNDFQLDGFAGEIGVRYGNFIVRATYASDRDGGARDGFREIFQIDRGNGQTGLLRGDREESYGINGEVFIPELRMGIFARYGQYNNQAVDEDGSTFNVGVSFLDVFSPNDRFGVAYGSTLSNKKLRDQVGANNPDVVEAFYDFALLPNLRLGFSYQGLNGFSESIFGVRLKTEFDVVQPRR